MRRFLVTVLVVLQVGLGNGLPHRSRRVDGDDLSPGTWRQTTPATIRLISPPAEDVQKPAVIHQDLTVADHDPPAPLEGDLDRELAELQTLRAQLAELAKVVSVREKWLAAAVSGTAPVTTDHSSTAITDCDSLLCALQALLRKAKYALSALLAAHEGENKSVEVNERNRTATTVIPLPPWQNLHHQNAADDGDDDAGHVDGDSGSLASSNSSSSSAGGRDFDLRHPAHTLFALLLAMLLLLSLFHALGSQACSGRRGGAEWDGLAPPATEPCRSLGESRRRWRWRWASGERVRGFWGRCPGTSEGDIKLGEEVDAGYGSGDEKREFGDGDWDEKRGGCPGEYGASYADADADADAEREYLVSEDGGLVLEGDDESGIESEADPQSRRGSLDGPPSPRLFSESSNIGDEIASFRLAVELVEGMFAASEEQRGRQR
ncbi:hypothetical protein N658DRAFT_493980 [Parathielavia hyrcaniae]|uniref:Uncharacterized protein n=1 Tax=Parathielavia hyrcaniae TaxID=113614 RepID=A0AAN6Q9Q6_9PEZI|nr:hypothetical protein N658DRAFT_493980 [Parathielavia hyrcaniae]